MSLFKLGDIVIFKTNSPINGHSEFLGEIVIESECKFGPSISYYAVIQIAEPNKPYLATINDASLFRYIKAVDAQMLNGFDNDKYYNNKYAKNLVGKVIYSWLGDMDLSLAKTANTSSGGYITINAGKGTVINMPYFITPTILQGTDCPYEFKIVLDTNSNGDDFSQAESGDEDRGGLKYL
jgi:hypothetical protein